MCAARGRYFNPFSPRRGKYPGNLVVEAKALSVTVRHCLAGVGARERLEGGRAVCVAPEGPECVVEVKDEDAWEGEVVCESAREGCCVGRWG